MSSPVVKMREGWGIVHEGHPQVVMQWLTWWDSSSESGRRRGVSPMLDKPEAVLGISEAPMTVTRQGDLVRAASDARSGRVPRPPHSITWSRRNFGGRGAIFWGLFCAWSRFYATCNDSTTPKFCSMASAYPVLRTLSPGAAVEWTRPLACKWMSDW